MVQRRTFLSSSSPMDQSTRNTGYKRTKPEKIMKKELWKKYVMVSRESCNNASIFPSCVQMHAEQRSSIRRDGVTAGFWSRPEGRWHSFVFLYDQYRLRKVADLHRFPNMLALFTAPQPTLAIPLRRV